MLPTVHRPSKSRLPDHRGMLCPKVITPSIILLRPGIVRKDGRNPGSLRRRAVDRLRVNATNNNLPTVVCPRAKATLLKFGLQRPAIARLSPPASAAFSISPFISLSHPASFALVTAWPSRNAMSGAGVPWSKSMRIDRMGWLLHGRWRIQTSRCEFQHCDHLFPRHVEPIHDFVDSGPGFKVFKHNRNRHTGIPKQPCPAHFAGNALHGGAW